jgi:hypothetical protein
LILAALLSSAAFAFPAVASADSPICHDGILSNDVGQGCTNDGAYGGSSGSSDPAICHDGILSDDRGMGCADGLYEATYGSGSTPSASSASYHTSYHSPAVSSYGGGSSNSMVNPYCESSGNAQARSPDGKYWGKYQFDYPTWVANGGSPGSYGNASASEQDQVASRVTYDAWPNC